MSLLAGALFGGPPSSLCIKYPHTKTPVIFISGSFCSIEFAKKKVSIEIRSGIIVTDISYDLSDRFLIVREFATLDGFCYHVA